jgi:hypothetical protein
VALKNGDIVAGLSEKGGRRQSADASAQNDDARHASPSIRK